VAKICRPRELLFAIGRKYPGVWGILDEMRAMRGLRVPAWPEYIYLPISAASFVLMSKRYYDIDVPVTNCDIGAVGALALWRLTQGIYRFDPTVYKAVLSTPVIGDLPCDVLHRLPEWSVYVETPDLKFNSEVIHGFWAQLDWDLKVGQENLLILLDADTGIIPITLHLGKWSLSEAIRRSIAKALHPITVVAELNIIVPELCSYLQEIVEPTVSLLLYLCSINAEIGDGTRRPRKPRPIHTKKGPRLFPVDNPTTWPVGVRMGCALRRTPQYEAVGNGHGHHRSPRPHIRRGHWHKFLTGPSNIPEERKWNLKWLPPIHVNVRNLNELPATIRPVAL